MPQIYETQALIYWRSFDLGTVRNRSKPNGRPSYHLQEVIQLLKLVLCPQNHNRIACKTGAHRFFFLKVTLQNSRRQKGTWSLVLYRGFTSIRQHRTKLGRLGWPGSRDLSTTDVKYTVFYCKVYSGTCQITTLRTDLRKRAALDKVACSGA